VAHGPWKKPLDFGGKLLSRYVRVEVRAGLSLRLGEARAESNPATLGKGKGAYT